MSPKRSSPYEEWLPALIPVWKKQARGKFIVNTEMGLAVLVNLRCGSMTVRMLLKPFEYVLSSERPKMLEGCRCIAIVREPFGRFVSSYSRVNKFSAKSPVARGLPFYKIKNPVKRFKQFVHDVDERLYDYHLAQQTRFIEDCGVEITDWVALENLTPTLKRWADTFGFDRNKVGQYNRTGNKAKKQLRKVLVTTPKLRKVVERMYADDFPLYERVIREAKG